MEISNLKYQNISFALAQESGGLDFFTLPIRPEELTRTDPSRLSAVNALDGAWVDSFGRGLSTLTITGNTGWRNKNGRGDGTAQFTTLRDDFILAWHDLREMKAKAGVNPDEVRLIFIDSINGNYVADVVPTSFSLRRSRSQPLLLMYNIALTVINDKAENPYPELMGDSSLINDPGASRLSMLSSIDKIASLQTGLRGALGSISSFGDSVHAWTDKAFGPVMSAAKDVIQTAADAKAVIGATAKVAIDLARDMSSVGTQLWGAVAAVTSLPNAIKSQVMQVKSEFSNLHCVLANGYKAAYQSENYADWYGSSNCSSTLVGVSSKLTGNPFETSSVLATTKVSDAAAKAIRDRLNTDPIATIDVAVVTQQIEAMMPGSGK